MDHLRAIAQEKKEESYSKVKCGDFQEAVRLSYQEDILTEIIEGVKDGGEEQGSNKSDA